MLNISQSLSQPVWEHPFFYISGSVLYPFMLRLENLIPDFNVSLRVYSVWLCVVLF